MTFEYLPADNLTAVSFSDASIQIPVLPSNIHVDESGVVYFNVVAQQDQLLPSEDNQQKHELVGKQSSYHISSINTKLSSLPLLYIFKMKFQLHD